MPFAVGSCAHAKWRLLNSGWCFGCGMVRGTRARTSVLASALRVGQLVTGYRERGAGVQLKNAVKIGMSLSIVLGRDTFRAARPRSSVG